jgi:hypothetical protein
LTWEINLRKLAHDGMNQHGLQRSPLNQLRRLQNGDEIHFLSDDKANRAQSIFLFSALMQNLLKDDRVKCFKLS